MTIIEAKTCSQRNNDVCVSGECNIRCNIEWYLLTGDQCDVSEYYSGVCLRGVKGCNVWHGIDRLL